VELAAWWEAEAQLEALWSWATWVQDLVLGVVDWLSLLVTSMSTVAELLENQIDAAATNTVRWGSCSTLLATVSHFPRARHQSGGARVRTQRGINR
jgi:hypothetical protein